MAITSAILNYRQFLKRRNYSVHTIKNYMHTLQQFVLWVDVPIEAVSHKKLLAYLDHLLDRRLQPKTINCHLDSIRGFYHYLIEEEQVAMINPVKRGYALRLSRPLPRHLRDEERLLKVVHHQRDRAMVMLMLRCGLRVEEVSRLKLAALDLRRSQVFVHQEDFFGSDSRPHPEILHQGLIGIVAQVHHPIFGALTLMDKDLTAPQVQGCQF